MNPLLEDSAASTTSPSYNAFFQDIRFAPFVHSILQEIASGSPTESLTSLNGRPQAFKSPTIACLVEHPMAEVDWNYLVMYEEAQDLAAADYRNNERFANIGQGTELIILCPLFFEQRRQVPTRGCPKVDLATNRFKGIGNPIYNTQAFVLLHELVHVYLGAIKEPQTGATWKILPGEFFSLQGCFDLPARFL